MINHIQGRAEKILMKIFKDWDIESLNEMMMVQDLLGILEEMNRRDVTVVVIINYNGTQKEKEESIKYVTSLFENKDDVVILTWAYVSTKEFPETNYYDASLGEIPEEEAAGKKPVPYDEFIERESKLLESIGFIDFNGFINYEFSKAYLYGNKLGKEILEYTKDK